MKTHDVSLTLSSTAPTRNGYSFLGWSTSNDTSVEYQAGAAYTANASVTLYAVWEANKYSVTYNANGGSNAPSAQTKIHDVELKLSDVIPVKTGYTFAGWATTFDATVAVYQAGDVYNVESDATLYAVWNVNTYTVTYDANGGSDAPSAQTKTYEIALTLSNAAPNKTGYTFVGWATSANATSALYQAGASYTNNADVTLYAVWEENVVATPDDSTDATGKDTEASTDNNATDKVTDKVTETDKSTESEKTSNSGCNSSAALSGLLVVGAIGVAVAFKKKKED